MLKNYLKTAFRNIFRFKTYSAINLVGLAVGMAACILIYLYVANDMSFDKFNKNYKRIYRVAEEITRNGKSEIWSLTPTGFANAFPVDFPGVKAVRTKWALGGDVVIKSGNKLFTVNSFAFADADFFNVFTFPLVEGDPRTALSEPFSVVVSQSEAQKVFGSADPMGKIIRVQNLFDFKITGVAKDPPGNSSIQFGYLGSFISLKHVFGPGFSLNNFEAMDYYTFLLLPEGMQVGAVRQGLRSFLTKYCGPEVSKTERLLLQPLSDIHFNKDFLFDFQNKRDIRYDYILSGIALFILLIACVNFINLSTARSATRAKEIGMRKVLGSRRPALIRQFILEFSALTLGSLALALVIVELSLPAFNTAADVNLSAGLLGQPLTLLSIFAIWVLVVMLACAYPSFYMSSFQPISIMKAGLKHGVKGGVTRKTLIVFQFAISVFLIAVTAVMWSQYNFLRSHKLGFDAQQVVVMPSNRELEGTFDAFKSQLLQHPAILSVAKANWAPGHPYNIEGYSWMGPTGQRKGSFYTSIVDPDYAGVIGLKFAAGRNFSWDMPSDWRESFVLNETAARMMGWTAENAIGQRVACGLHPDGRVIGVVKDFNFQSLQRGIEPVVMLMDSSQPYMNVIAMKISSKNIPATIGYLGSLWKQLSPDLPFEYHFLDQSFEQLYKSEQRLGQIFSAFSLLSIVIACLGLFGLASYAVQERTKEMGIRKVVGATSVQIVGLVVGDFLKFVLIANVIAWPLAYYAMQKWLQGFAYRVDVGLWTFIFSGGVALMIALATVSMQAVKAATANPIESLRYE